MEIQEQIESGEDDASDIMPEAENEQENNRLYGNNGFQGPLTEDGSDEESQRSEGSVGSSIHLHSVSVVRPLFLIGSLLIYLTV